MYLIQLLLLIFNFELHLILFINKLLSFFSKSFFILLLQLLASFSMRPLYFCHVLLLLIILCLQPFQFLVVFSHLLLGLLLLGHLQQERLPHHLFLLEGLHQV